MYATTAVSSQHHRGNTSPRVEEEQEHASIGRARDTDNLKGPRVATRFGPFALNIVLLGQELPRAVVIGMGHPPHPGHLFATPRAFDQLAVFQTRFLNQCPDHFALASTVGLRQQPATFVLAQSHQHAMRTRNGFAPANRPSMACHSLCIAGANLFVNQLDEDQTSRTPGRRRDQLSAVDSGKISATSNNPMEASQTREKSPPPKLGDGSCGLVVAQACESECEPQAVLPPRARPSRRGGGRQPRQFQGRVGRLFEVRPLSPRNRRLPKLRMQDDQMRACASQRRYGKTRHRSRMHR